MPDPATVLAVANRVLGAIGLVSKGRQQRASERRETINALYTALNETRLYNNERMDGLKRNRKRESAIAALWSQAAIVVEPFDKELARVCHNKCDYWCDDELWDDKRIKSNGIEIENVMKKVRKLLLHE